MKRNYDTTSKPRELEIGSSALMRIPDLGGKLSDTWDGPYEVIRKVTPVTYELAVPNKRGKKGPSTYQQIIPEAVALKIVVADEEEEEENTESVQGAYTLGKDLTSTQRQQLGDLLQEFQDVITTNLGIASGIEHKVDTKDHAPIRVLPYRIAPAWKDQLRAEIKSLLQAGIIIPFGENGGIHPQTFLGIVIHMEVSHD